MKHAFQLVAGTMLLVLGAALGGCHAPDSSGKAAQPMELKMYSVPVAQSENLSSALTLAMVNKVSVSQAAPGQLLVYAPRDAQASIGTAIEALAKATPKQTPPAQVSVHFWVIDGEPGAGDDDPALKDLAANLAPLRQAMGSLHFHLDQVAALTATSNERSSLTTVDAPYQRQFQFQIAAIEGDTARLSLSYGDNGGHGLGALNTHIDATFGQYIMLAQAPGGCPYNTGMPILPGNNAPPCSAKPALRLLVVRVDRLPAKA